MGLGGGTHGKAATKQRRGWVDHGFRHFLKLIIHACPSMLFFHLLICPSVFLCLSVYSTLPPTPLWFFLFSFSLSLLHTALLINETLFPPHRCLFSDLPHPYAFCRLKPELNMDLSIFMFLFCFKNETFSDIFRARLQYSYRKGIENLQITVIV